MFSNIDKNWLEILDTPELISIQEEISKITPNEKLCPPKELWFEFARLTPFSNIKVVIIGQDPYYTIGDAHGLAFSSLNKKMPPSLKNIFKCLQKHDLIKEIPNKSNLTYWAQQGVLLLNSAFSTEIGVASKHIKIWTSYTTKIIKSISDNNDSIIFLLWGNLAQKFAPIIKQNKMIWCHPSPLAQSRLPEEKKFINCNHFIKVNEISEQTYNQVDKVDWNINKPPTKIHKVFTDGSCRGNGSKTAIGGYAAIFVEGPWKGKQICSQLKNTTNIRAEGTAIIKVFEELIANVNEWDYCELYTDSDFWIKMIYNYMPKWSVNQFKSKANPDLTINMWELWNKISDRVKLIWVPAHNKKNTENSNDPFKRFCYIHNNEVDKLATSMSK